MWEKILWTKDDYNKAYRKAKRREILNKGLRLWEENKVYILGAAPIVLGVVGLGKSFVRFAGKHHTLRMEERAKDRRCYDPRLGHYWELNRKLSNKEWRAIDKRRKDGERLSDILDKMNVLK